MKNNINQGSSFCIFGAHPNLPINKVFNLSDYSGLKAYWGFN